MPFVGGITRTGFRDARSGRELRHNLSAHDAAYVALAEALRCPLVTGEARSVERLGCAAR